MKYGDTLRQRSIPEWGHYNIDYDYLKELIKHQTTPGTNKAVSIPGQGESTERAFGDTFFRVLAEQHDRINLFIRSKSGEIERRLEHISKTLQQLRTKRDPVSGRLPARTVERYAKIEADVISTGEEIRSLSRFQVTQRTGFIKILKKYKRWTKDGELAHVFKQEISSRPDSLFQLDLGYLLDQFIEALDTLRSAFDANGTAASNATSVTGQSSAARISRSLEKGDDLDFDLALETVPLGTKGSKATYWIHPDHIVEAQVLLLQHMRLYISKAKRNSSNRPTPLRRHSSTTNIDPYFGNEDTTGLVVLDHAESFAFKQNASTIGAAEDMQGGTGIKAAAQVRCCASGQAAVVVCSEADSQASLSNAKTVKMERRYLKSFLDLSVDESSVRPSCSPKENVPAIRQWFTEHPSTKPIAGALLKRTRFTGLHNNSAGGIWATLDKDICLTDRLFQDLGEDDWTSASRSEATKRFPHAILEIRREGNQAMSLIHTLDRSHLVERVRGFSLEAHAVWTCCKPSAMSAPLWISLLEKDIRKLPEPVQRRSRKARGSMSASVSQLSPPATSTSNTSYDGQSSPVASRYEESSATSVHEFVDPPSLQAFRKKTRRPYADYPPPMIRADTEPEAQPRYWNEYDHPEDEEGGYYIYVDPDAPVKFPGQDFFEACARKTKRLFGIREESEEASLSGTEDSDDDDTTDSSPVIHPANYGTIGPNHDNQNAESKGYFSTLFRSLRDPKRDADLFNERRALLGQVESHQHKVELTKMRFYSTALGAAVVLDLILGLMITTSRKKERGVVDAGVIIGTICTLVLCVVAVISMQTRQERLGWVHQGAVMSIAGAVVALDIVFLLWVMRI